jgi:hypothetical protein
MGKLVNLILRRRAAHALYVASPPMPKRMVRALHYNRCRNAPNQTEICLNFEYKNTLGFYYENMTIRRNITHRFK